MGHFYLLITVVLTGVHYKSKKCRKTPPALVCCAIWSPSGTNLGHNCIQDALKKAKNAEKNTQITELYKNTMLQDLFVGQKGPKSGSALGHPFGLEAKLWRVPGHP